MAKIDGPCKSCIHWEEIHEKKAGECPGECHRYPPENLEAGGVFWIVTNEFDWCGEYKPKA